MNISLIQKSLPMMNKMKYALALCCTVSLSANAIYEQIRQKAEQGDYNAQKGMGDDACINGDYYSALDWYEKAARQAYGKDDQQWQQYQLAMMYYDGQCIGANYAQGASNYPKALEWYEKVVYDSNPKKSSYYYDAQLQIGTIYWLGEGGITPNGTQARAIFDKLANIPDKDIQNEIAENKTKGLPEGISGIQEIRSNARLNLARMYYYGRFVAQNDQLAYQWATKAMQDDNYYGAELVAVLLYNGLGVTQNRANATKLMAKACDTGGNQRFCDRYKQMKANLPVKY